MVVKCKVIIVTGGCSGIGWGITRAAAQAGAKVIAGQRSVSGQDRIEELTNAGLDAHFVRLDVADPGAVTSFVDEVYSRFGRVDVLINNAGITIERDFFQMRVDELDMLWNVNVRSIFLMSQAVAHKMVANGRGGAIVNVSSNHGTASVPGYEMYAGTKGAIAAMSRAMAWSLGPHGIRVNTLSPGLTLTENVQKVADGNPRLARVFNEMHATKDVATVEEIAQAALFLASDAAGAITGAELIADKGMSAQLCRMDDLK